MTQPYEVARTWLKVPFLHMGRSRTGIDCVGLLMMVAKELGVHHVDNPHYGREPNRINNAFDLRHYLQVNCGQPVNRDVQPNDVLLIRFRPNHAPSHLALASPHPEGVGMIHTYGAVGEVIEHRIDARWQSKIVEVYRWPGKELD